MRHKELSPKNKYYLPRPVYLLVIRYCLCYPEWKRQLDELDADIRKAITYDGDRVQSSGDWNPTEDIAMRRAVLTGKMSVIEDAVEDVAPEIGDWLLRGVTEGASYWTLAEEGIPCGRNYYLQRRRGVLWTIAQKI